MSQNYNRIRQRYWVTRRRAQKRIDHEWECRITLSKWKRPGQKWKISITVYVSFHAVLLSLSIFLERFIVSLYQAPEFWIDGKIAPFIERCNTMPHKMEWALSMPFMELSFISYTIVLSVQLILLPIFFRLPHQTFYRFRWEHEWMNERCEWVWQRIGNARCACPSTPYIRYSNKNGQRCGMMHKRNVTLNVRDM